MKKIFIVALISILSSAIFALDAKVISVSGKVQVQKGEAWVDLKPGDSIKKGEMIQTGFKSEAQLSLVSGNQNSTLTVAPLSRLTIEQLAENPTADKASVYLTTGSVKSEIKKTEDRRASYTVRSPVATASVRGTIISVTTGFDTTSLVTEEGTAAFYETAADAKAPAISTAEEDNAFANLSSEEMTNANLYPKADTSLTSVKKGESAKVAGTTMVNSSDSARETVESLSSVTVDASSSEVVNTGAASYDSGRSVPIQTTKIKLQLKLKD